METQGTPNSQNDFEKEKVEGLIFPDFKTLKTSVIKIVWYWHKYRQIV